MRPLAIMLLLSACAESATVPDDAMSRISHRTAGQATAMGASDIASGIYRSSGGSFLGQLGSAAVRNTASELQRAWNAR
jgi:hypothetical protein